MGFEHELDQAVTYLASPLAMRLLEANCYWPKWDSPWWHMLLLHEMGETHRIPESTIKTFIESVNAMPVKIFPIEPSEMPAGADPYRDTACHCQIGNIYRVLSAWGVDVDVELPWIRPWFVRYQMTDGGFNCDESAYRVKDECPSSMVGTIAAFEAILLHTHGMRAPEEDVFLEKAAQFLMRRKLMLGSDTLHNAKERASAANWLNLCFPRFYLYDVLRGLTALAIWSEQAGRDLPEESIRPVVEHLEHQFPDGKVRIGRPCVESPTTIVQTADGRWDNRRHPASVFPLLAAVSKVDQMSPYLSKEWSATRRRLRELIT
jgi:hypothetical protein